MAITNQPINPHNNTTHNIVMGRDNYTDPYTLSSLMEGKAGLPKETTDLIHEHCNDIAQDSWMGFLDKFNYKVAVETDYVTFVETKTPNTIIDDDGAVTRAGNVFTIDWSAVEGWETGDDAFIYQPSQVISVADDTKIEHGVITAVDKTTNTLTAVCQEGADWTIGTANLHLDITGGDWDAASCAPDGDLEMRKKTTRQLKLATVKASQTYYGGKKYSYCIDNENWEWYDDETNDVTKKLNRLASKGMLTGIPSVSGSAAHTAGKYGTLGVFKNIETNGVTLGEITTVADVDALVDYYDGLGFNGDKSFYIYCDTSQYRKLEAVASLIATSQNITLNMDVSNTPENMVSIGFKGFTRGGYTFYFNKWGLTTGNSSLGKGNFKSLYPKGMIVPMGTVKTTVNGIEMRVPYLFKVYQDKKKLGKYAAGEVRTHFDGAFAGQGTCEYKLINKSTTVGIASVCTEALAIIK